MQGCGASESKITYTDDRSNDHVQIGIGLDYWRDPDSSSLQFQTPLNPIAGTAEAGKDALNFSVAIIGTEVSARM
jgi:hypothetical protein